MSSSCCRSIGLAAVLAALAPVAHAAGFAAGIAPSKFELSADPGEILRDTLTIVNPSGAVTDYLFRTADWQLTDAGGVEYFEDVLVDGSCRPWVRLERRQVRIDAGSQKVYRFEVHVPEDAPPGLCRFAILIEPAEAYNASVGDGAISVPIVGRYAVISYVTVGDASATIENLGLGTAENRGQRLPAITLRNTGQTYDRAFGQVMATDSDGVRTSLVPSNFPILPGRTEQILLLPDTDPNSASAPALNYPLVLDGTVEIGGQRIRIEQPVE